MAKFKIKAKGTLRFMDGDFVNFTKTLKKRLDEQQRQAVRAWLKTLLEHIPTYTGTSRGVYKPLGRVLHAAVNKFDPNGKGALGNLANAERKKYFQYPKGGRIYPLGFDEGAQYSTFKFEQRGMANGIQFKFTFDNNLPYLVWNDMYPAPSWIKLPSNPPWKSLEAGARAWRDYVLNVIPLRLPKLKDAVKIVTIKVR